MTTRVCCILAMTGLLLAGCRQAHAPSTLTSPPSNPQEIARTANQAFLHQKTFDPWVLTSHDPQQPIPAYLANGREGWRIQGNGDFAPDVIAGKYQNGQIVEMPHRRATTPSAGSVVRQELDLRDGGFRTTTGQSVQGIFHNTIAWPALWKTSDIVIDGDPEAQQVTHTNLFYLLSSTYPGSTDSIPPMGLSSNVYGGHIFWDADVWMLPALIVQHPEYAKPIVDYRYKLLAQAKKNAQQHGFAGAEYPWESADTGKEVAPPEFAKERHITADVAFAAWQYYLWTGDKAYLAREGWPLLQATAQYWASRVTQGSDGNYHINGVLSPDETAGVVNDDAYTNGVVRYNLKAATAAAQNLGQHVDPRWAAIANRLYFPTNKTLSIPAEHAGPISARFAAKQADTLLLIYPLNVPYDKATLGKMLDYYAAHTIQTGPAMTDSIQTIVAARLGRAPQSLDEFHSSYRPFERAPWDAFSEKRTTDNVYFLTGLAGCVQSVLYGFAGLRVVANGEQPVGTKLAASGDAALYADPHLPPGWGKLVVEGIRFRGKTLDLTVLPGNVVHVAVQKPSSPR